jgi:hypothetical protein
MLAGVARLNVFRSMEHASDKLPESMSVVITTRREPAAEA